jgi:hypothetical protein
MSKTVDKVLDIIAMPFIAMTVTGFLLLNALQSLEDWLRRKK